MCSLPHAHRTHARTQACSHAHTCGLFQCCASQSCTWWHREKGVAVPSTSWVGAGSVGKRLEGKLNISASQVPPGNPKRVGNSSIGRQEALTWPQDPTRRYNHNPIPWVWTSVWERWSITVGSSRAWSGLHSLRRPPALAVLSHLLPFPVPSKAATLTLRGSCSRSPAAGQLCNALPSISSLFSPTEG